MKILNNTYKNKMKALLDGLECQEIDHFMKIAKTKDYKFLGEAIATRVKTIVELADTNKQ